MLNDSCVKNILNSIIQFKCKELQATMQARLKFEDKIVGSLEWAGQSPYS